MTLTLHIALTLDSQYLAVGGGKWGMLDRTQSELFDITNGSIVVMTSIESLAGGDYRGLAVAGKKGDRFVYFGLQENGQWLRRWKLRHHQLDAIFENDWTSQALVYLYLGKDVTPVMTF